VVVRLPRDNTVIITSAREAWLERALSLDPVPRGPCEAAVATLFEQAGFLPPPVTWVSTPVAGAEEVDRMLYRDQDPYTRPRAGFWSGPEPGIERLRAALAQVYEAGLSQAARRKIDGLLRGPLRRRLDPLHAWLQQELARRLDRPLPFGPEVQVPAWPARWHHALFAGGTFLDVVDVAMHDCARRLGLDYGELSPALDAFIVLAGVGYWWPYRELTVLCRRPEVLRLDEQGRPHAQDRPAVCFANDFRLYAWHGTMVPRRVVDIHFLDAGRILAEPNGELRRMMIERYGLARFRQEAGARRLHRDRWGTLWQVPVRGDEPVVTVEVVNSTPEPDGRRRRYELRVPPGMRTALEAVAWTFGLSPRDYAERMVRQT
jgi:hypothetical protein